MKYVAFALLALGLVQRGATTEMFPALRKHRKASLVAQASTSPAEAGLQQPDTAAVVVPPPPNAGPEGMPVLPAVPAMVGSAVEVLKGISAQASSLEERAVQVQADNAAKMKKMKAFFERNLKTREEANLEVVAANAKISSEIDALKKDNVARRKHAQELVEANKFMRSEIHALEASLGAGRDFAQASLKASDDRKAKELVVLGMEKEEAHKVEDKTEKKTKVEDKSSTDKDEKESKDTSADDEKDDDDDDDATAGDSFLALSSRHGHRLFARAKTSVEVSAEDAALADAYAPEQQTPADIVKLLTAGVENLAKEQKASEEHVKALFATDVEAETKRQEALVQQQQSLNATRSSLKVLQAKLGVAEDHLTSTKSLLSSKLRELGLFVQRLAHLALAPQGEAPRLLKALPVNVVEPAAQDASAGAGPLQSQ